VWKLFYIIFTKILISAKVSAFRFSKKKCRVYHDFLFLFTSFPIFLFLLLKRWYWTLRLPWVEISYGYIYSLWYYILYIISHILHYDIRISSSILSERFTNQHTARFNLLPWFCSESRVQFFYFFFNEEYMYLNKII